MLGSQKNVPPDYQSKRWIFAFDRWLYSPAYLEILRQILRPEIGEFLIHLLYNTRCGR